MAHRPLGRQTTRPSQLHRPPAAPDPLQESAPREGTPATALGQGSIDYRPIFAAAAQTGHIKHCFVEQEEFNMPAMQELKIDAEYMRKLHA